MITIASKHYLKIQQHYPDYINALEVLGKTVKQAGPLDDKTSQLIQLAAAAAIRSEGAVHSHSKRAINAGAQVEEIYHCLILLTSTIGFPNVMAALTWASDVIDDN
ncbi:MAG: carboxymuconolactone decarboxylase family protein [Colwellia sp.]|nr:carboxymuconolactone decarboxylase family protein [Colwellia sp.]